MSRRFLFRRTRNPLVGPTGAHGLTGMATLLLSLSLLLQLMDGAAQHWLRYERDAIMAGQVWRLFTGHLVHLSWPHLMLNAIAMALLSSLLGKQQRATDWWLITLISSLAVGAGLLVLNPAVAWYAGLSGIVHGFFAAGCVALLRRSPAVAALALIALAGKLVWEQTHPMTPAHEALVGGAIIIDAHLYGAIGGLLAGAAIHARVLCRMLRRTAGRGRMA